MLHTQRSTASNKVAKPKRRKISKRATRISDAFEVYDGNVVVYRTTHSGEMW